MKPLVKFPVEPVTQHQLVDILCLEEEIKIIRKRIRNRKTQLAAAIAAGSHIESGAHTAVLDAKGQVRVYPWRGAILRHDDEDVSHMTTGQPKAKPTVGPLPILNRPNPPVA